MVAPALVGEEPVGYVIKAKRQQTITPPTCKSTTFCRRRNSQKT
jgi:hypothetical protein